MVGSDDRSLDLGLPWGRPSPPSPAAGREQPEGQAAGPELPETAGRTEADGRSAPPPGPPDTKPLGVSSAQVAAATSAAIEDGLRRLHHRLCVRFDRLEERTLIRDAGLDARLEKVEARLEALHAASREAVDLPAGQVVARLEQVEALLEKRHEEVVAKLEEARAAAAKAIGGLGMLLDADLIRLTEQWKERGFRSVQARSGDAESP